MNSQYNQIVESLYQGIQNIYETIVESIFPSPAYITTTETTVSGPINLEDFVLMHGSKGNKKSKAQKKDSKWKPKSGKNSNTRKGKGKKKR